MRAEAMYRPQGLIFSPRRTWNGIIRDEAGAIIWDCCHFHRTYGRALGRVAAQRCADRELARRLAT